MTEENDQILPAQQAPLLITACEHAEYAIIYTKNYTKHLKIEVHEQISPILSRITDVRSNTAGWAIAYFPLAILLAIWSI